MEPGSTSFKASSSTLKLGGEKAKGGGSSGGRQGRTWGYHPSAPRKPASGAVDSRANWGQEHAGKLQGLGTWRESFPEESR